MQQDAVEKRRQFKGLLRNMLKLMDKRSPDRSGS
jgi:hypothetical protein